MVVFVHFEYYVFLEIFEIRNKIRLKSFLESLLKLILKIETKNLKQIMNFQQVWTFLLHHQM